jgi:hypothetical protein
MDTSVVIPKTIAKTMIVGALTLIRPTHDLQSI